MLMAFTAKPRAFAMDMKYQWYPLIKAFCPSVLQFQSGGNKFAIIVN
jgi:hypothetical protein